MRNLAECECLSNILRQVGEGAICQFKSLSFLFVISESSAQRGFGAQCSSFCKLPLVQSALQCVHGQYVCIARGALIPS